jgi:hypothetical protein
MDQGDSKRSGVVEAHPDTKDVIQPSSCWMKSWREKNNEQYHCKEGDVKKIAFPGGIAPSVILGVAVLGLLFAVKLVHGADAKPSWQATWEQTVAAAKKEGRLNVLSLAINWIRLQLAKLP